MALDPLISTDDLGIAVQGAAFTDAADVARAGSIVGRVSAMARYEAATTWADSTTGALDTVPDVVVSVVTNACLRHWTTTPGAIQEMAGPTSAMWDRDSARGVFFTDDELRILRNFRTLWRPQISSLKTGGLWGDAPTTDAADAMRDIDVMADVTSHPTEPDVVWTDE